MRNSLVRGGAAVGAAASLALMGCSGQANGEGTPSPSASVSSPSSQGASGTAGDLALTDFWVRQSSLDLAAAYGEIENHGAAGDALTRVEAQDVPVVEFHHTAGNVMGQVDSFEIPAGGELELAPGGNHIMLVGLTDPLVPGDSVQLTFTFGSGASTTLTAPVVPYSGDDEDGHDHDGH